MISIFGSTGFIGSNWMKKYPDISFPEERDCTYALNNKILYFRGTTTNYNVFTDIHKDIDTNLTLFITTLNSAAEIPNMEFNCISSWFVNYPKGLYSATKLCQEHLLESYCKTFNQKYRILRLSNIIGGDKGKSKQKNALEFIIDKLKQNEKVDIYTGDNYRNYLHVSDCCKAIKLILDNGDLNTNYNIGDIQSYRIIDIVEYCKNKIGSTSEISIIETPEFHKIVQVKDYFMNTEKIRELGFVPDYNIWQTLDELCK